MGRTHISLESELASARQPEAEWLDELPASDARAIGSRKDLRRLNRLMRHVSLLLEAWRKNEPDRWVSTVVEIGAGDGTFLLNCARALSAKSGPFKVILVDRAKLVTPQTLDGFRELGWNPEVVTADVFEWLAQARVVDSAFIANLFLHHFDDEQLKELFGHISGQANFFVGIEPRRAFGPLFFSKLLGLIGCNSVTRHDAVVSVRAGFKGREISTLWPSRNWFIHEEEAGTFSHRFTAQRFTDASAAPRKTADRMAPVGHGS
jgi:hypothetical protein